MSNEKLKQLLASLHATLEQTEEADPETLALVRELDGEIHRLVAEDADHEDYASALDRAQALETRFAVDHPVAERFLREIMDVLARLGI